MTAADLLSRLRSVDVIHPSRSPRRGAPGDRRLIAYVVAGMDPAPSSQEVRRFLKQKLPEYMVSSTVVFLDAVPLTVNGKVDRRALPAPERSRVEPDAAFAAPRNVVEELVAAIWKEVLKLDEIGIHDNFFELGGHSLLATQVISRLREAFGLDLPLRCLFETSTVAGLAERIEALLWTQEGFRPSVSDKSEKREEIKL